MRKRVRGDANVLAPCAATDRAGSGRRRRRLRLWAARAEVRDGGAGAGAGTDEMRARREPNAADWDGVVCFRSEPSLALGRFHARPVCSVAPQLTSTHARTHAVQHSAALTISFFFALLFFCTSTRAIAVRTDSLEASERRCRRAPQRFATRLRDRSLQVHAIAARRSTAAFWFVFPIRVRSLSFYTGRARRAGAPLCARHGDVPGRPPRAGWGCARVGQECDFDEIGSL